MEGTDKWEKIVTLDSTVTLYVVQNLKERSEKLYFRVTAENPIGLSEPAETGAVALKTHASKCFQTKLFINLLLFLILMLLNVLRCDNPLPMTI